MFRGRARTLLLAGLGLAGLVAVTALLPTITERLSGQPDTLASKDAHAFRVENLDSIDELKTAFNEDVGRVRIFLLLSPT